MEQRHIPPSHAHPPTPSQGTPVPYTTHQVVTATQHVLQEPGAVGDDQGSSLVEMLNRIDELDSIPQLQVSHTGPVPPTEGVHTVEISTEGVEIATTAVPEVATPPTVAMTAANEGGGVVELPENVIVQLATVPIMEKRAKAGRPRTRPPRERQVWHYHLGGVRHCRVPLTPEIREVLEVAYVSRIMSKNFRKEGQPEKERIARITGLEVEKVQEWFKNRRKKDKLHIERSQGRKLPKGRRGRRSTNSSMGGSISGIDQSGSSAVSGIDQSMNSTVTGIDQSMNSSMSRINPSVASSVSGIDQSVGSAVQQGIVTMEMGGVTSLPQQLVSQHLGLLATATLNQHDIG